MPIYKMNGKKDGKQQYRVRINYIDDYGKSKQMDRVAYGLNEAKDLENNLMYELKNKELINSRIKINELYERYIDQKKHKVRVTSLDKTTQILNRDVLPILGEYRIDKLTVPVLEKWKNTISDKQISITTKKNIYTEFNAMLNYAVTVDILPTNPLKKIGNFKEIYFETAEDKLHYYTAEEFKKYIQVAKTNANNITDWGYYVFFNIAFYTGLRKGEINALKWSDIQDNQLSVKRSVAQKIKGGDIETPPKNKSSYRTIQMPLPLIKILAEHKSRQKELDGFTEDYRVCGGIAFLRDTTLAKKNIDFAAKANLPQIRIHDFRHSHATLLANSGINIQEIARRLGHSKIEITWNTYAHLYPREEEKAIEILNEIH